MNLIGTELPDKKKFNLNNGTWLSGIGSGAWFKIENQLSEKIGVPVMVQHSAKGKGKLVLKYNNLDELDGILKHIK